MLQLRFCSLCKRPAHVFELEARWFYLFTHRFVLTFFFLKLLFLWEWGRFEIRKWGGILILTMWVFFRGLYYPLVRREEKIGFSCQCSTLKQLAKPSFVSPWSFCCFRTRCKLCFLNDLLISFSFNSFINRYLNFSLQKPKRFVHF